MWTLGPHVQAPHPSQQSHPLVTREAHGNAHRNTGHLCWQYTLRLGAHTGLGVKLRELGSELQQQPDPAAGHVWAPVGHGPVTRGRLAHGCWAVAEGKPEQNPNAQPSA